MNSEHIHWQPIIARYARPDLARSLRQVADSVLPFALLFCAALWSYHISFWLALLLSVLAAGFMVRTFIIFHDCGHGSFFASQRLNDVLGFITGATSPCRVVVLRPAILRRRVRRERGRQYFLHFRHL